MATKVKLSDLKTLTFYAGEKTKARRSSPIPQLTCVGKPCSLYTPDVVRCTNAGGKGVEVDWKCEADLPESLRFGRVEVSCEGWSKPGDPNVLKGSCGLEYRLVRIPDKFREGTADTEAWDRRWTDPDYLLKSLFVVLWAAVLFFILYHLIKSCLFSRLRQQTPGNTNPSGGGFGGWFNNNNSPRPGPGDAPPPYKQRADQQQHGWRPGFWTGLGAGGLLGRYFRPSPYQNAYHPYTPPAPSAWDWERPWFGGAGAAQQPRMRPTRSSDSNYDRGEGTSNLGTMRSSTGYGGSRVR